MISFAWTTPAVLAAHFAPDLPFKTETRRDWTKAHADRMVRKMERGRLFNAWTKTPCFGGEKFGEIEVLDIRKERQGDIGDESWDREGFSLLQLIDAKFGKHTSADEVWNYWRGEGADESCYVVSFRLVNVTPVGHRLWGELVEAHGERLFQRLPRPELRV